MRLIDADALKPEEAYIDWANLWKASHGKYKIVLFEDIENAPTYTESVVRCKECIYFDDFHDGRGFCFVGGKGAIRRDDFYCADGERETMSKKQIIDILYEFGARADITIESLADLISDIAVPVVRCGDCKYWQFDPLAGQGWCHGVQRDRSFYCAEGERRDNDKDG